jgi:ankyrin repeat protein
VPGLSKPPVFNFNALNKRGQTALHYAIEKNDHEMLKVLLQEKTIDPFQVDSVFY